MDPRLAEVQMQQIPEPYRVANIDRFVEAVVLPPLFDRVRWNLHTVTFAQKLIYLTFDRPARNHLNNEENDECDSNEGGEDQKQASDEISGHFGLGTSL